MQKPRHQNRYDFRRLAISGRLALGFAIALTFFPSGAPSALGQEGQPTRHFVPPVHVSPVREDAPRRDLKTAPQKRIRTVRRPTSRRFSDFRIDHNVLRASAQESDGHNDLRWQSRSDEIEMNGDIGTGAHSATNRQPARDSFTGNRQPRPIQPASARSHSIRRWQDDATPQENSQADDDDPLDPRSAQNQKSCDDYRRELLNDPITGIDINISPPRPSVRQQDGIDYSQISRTWTNSYGDSLGTGTLVDVFRGYAVIETGSGKQRIPIAHLSDTDLAILTQYWRIPNECTLGDYQPIARCWAPHTFTWKASALCHNPLYFEDIQLERYGHSAGPIRQPIRSTRHFFTRLVSLPYLTAIHPPNECVYALGYYRPGNCAPWLVDPIPLSLSGARRQAAFITGGAFLLP